VLVRRRKYCRFVVAGLPVAGKALLLIRDARIKFFVFRPNIILYTAVLAAKKFLPHWLGHNFSRNFFHAHALRSFKLESATRL